MSARSVPLPPAVLAMPAMRILATVLLVVACVLFGPFVAMADELPKDTKQIESLTLEQAQKLARDFPGVEFAWQVPGGQVYLKNCLPLNGLKTLDAATAKALSQYSKGSLVLDGLATLNADTAKALAEFKGEWLFLNVLTTLDTETVKALGGYGGRLWLGNGMAKQFIAQHRFDEDTALTLATLLRGNLKHVTAFESRNSVATAEALAHAALLRGDLQHVTAFESRDSVAIAKVLAARKGPLALPNLKRISPRTLAALLGKRDVEIPRIETLTLIPEPDGSITDDFVIPKSLRDRKRK